MSNARNIANLPNGDDAPLAAVRAWGSYNQNSTNDATFRDSFNVQSIADYGTYQVITFAEPMPHANYSVVASNSYRINAGNVEGQQVPYSVYSTTQFGIQPYSDQTPYSDTEYVQFVVVC